jgi:hypothetical protein
LKRRREVASAAARQVQHCLASLALYLLAGVGFARLNAAEPSSSITPLFLPQVPCGIGSWDSQPLGNHRAVLEVSSPADAVSVRIPWRRHDASPEKKNVLVVEAGSGRQVTNVVLRAVNSAYGDIVFQAQTAGTYYAYYLPSVTRGKNYLVASYQAPESHADPAWLRKNGLDAQGQGPSSPAELPSAKVVELQASDEFNSFCPMELAAAPEEVAQLLASHPGKPFLLFPEDRALPIRMTERLPVSWVREGPKSEFQGTAAPGEFYVFQIGLYAATTDLKDVSVLFTRLRASHGNPPIPVSALRCFNLGGTNWSGHAFTKKLSVPKGRVQALWCGVQIPEDAVPGIFKGHVTIQPAGRPSQTIALSISVTGYPRPDHGDSQPSRQSRLRWLDSTLAQDDRIVRPFSPVRVTNNTLSILGREVALSPSGLPGRIISYFSPEGTSLQEAGTALLAAPMELVAEGTNGQRLAWRGGEPRLTRQAEGVAEWTAQSVAGPLRLDVRGKLEFDGFAHFEATVSSTKPLELNDLRLELPLVKSKARYFMGLGLQGSRFPASLDWKWDIKKHQDSAWLGDTDAGLQFKLLGENYERPLLTNFYEDKPLNLPPAWHNAGRGGVSLREAGDAVLISCYGGRRRLEPGQKLHFDFELLLTPFKPLDTRAQWRTRFFHSFKPVDEVVRAGANTINVHHANDANPYINYPFLHVDQMRNYVAEAHQKGLKVKIYYTIRELSNHAAELFALRSLGDEIFPAGKGGGDAWLQEHLEANYIPGWFVARWQDAAVINQGCSRWDNYYVEGLDWLVRNVGIDGLYIDDLAFDRVTMKRVRKVLDRGRPGALIDLHSANQFNPRDGFGSCANVYLEHFPYLDRLWFGEYFKPDSPPDFWLIEMSGIPFGLMGEMLQDGGNRWRGMLYGMTSRIPYDGNDPSPIWKVWDEFKIQESQMFGYWSPRCPVRTDNTNVLATAYVGKGKTLLSVASWAPEDSRVRLSMDWKALGLDPATAVLAAPEVAGFQTAARFKPTDTVPVPKGKGWLLYIAPEEPSAIDSK